MARSILPYFNASAHGEGIEGTANYANILVENLLLPTFLMVLYALSIYVWTNGENKIGGGLFFISLVFFLMAMIAQTFTAFAQIVIFIFFVGMIAGIVVHFVEG